MASNSRRRSGSSDRSTNRKRVVIGARETVRVRYTKGEPEVEATPKPRAPRAARGEGSRLVELRKQDRERRQASIRRRRVAIVAGIVVLVALAAWGVTLLRSSETFAVRRVRVVGASRVTSDHIVELAEIPSGATLFEVDRDRIAQRVESDPWVASATVSRNFPHGLVIHITERTPAVWVDIGGRASWLLSADGFWLRPRANKEGASLPVVTDVEGLAPQVGNDAGSDELTNALAALRGLSDPLRRQVRFVSAPSVEKTAMVTAAGVQIFVGPATEMKKKDAVIRAILAQHKGKLVYINVRTPDRPTWRGLEKP